jgi:predicted nucleic acid-binding protein
LSRVFADTSSFYALLSTGDTQHERARRAFLQLGRENAALVSTSYVLVETYALLDRRLGREASRRFHEELAPLLEIIWVDRELHEQAMDLFLARSRSVSLVDDASFVCIRALGLDRVWAMDRRFAAEGFEMVE